MNRLYQKRFYGFGLMPIAGKINLILLLTIETLGIDSRPRNRADERLVSEKSGAKK